ncbi:hypothetical protein L6164_031659 [Bauhinia variegata]|uniref:Uncharacterized protein n=1 Tax=Bauhinia variegata TaxID=167791 RepID=A0ACB9LGL3_BAUVA|nr:hypothetical protein L6164_031659 [Bauhinia variegata]
MTTLILSPLFKLLVSLHLLCYSGYSFAYEGEETTVQDSSMQPSCIPPYKGSEEGTYLKLVDKHGPCSPLIQKGRVNALSDFESLKHDEARIEAIQSRIGKPGLVTLPTANRFIITVGLGTPKKEVSLSFDTGSYLAWTQCKSRSGRYYFRQKHPIFDPSKSRTFSHLKCSSPYCSGSESTCIYPRCKYLSGYGDGTRVEGYYSQDRLALTSSDVIDNFVFGCSENNTGLFNEFEEDGIIGLGQHPLSIVYQTAKKHHKIFSYCLPSKTVVGFLRFGGTTKQSLVYTPIITYKSDTSAYGIGITGIALNGKRLPIPSSLFAKAGAIIDSGTTTSRLPPEIYKPFRDQYRKAMSKYKFVDPKYVGSGYDILDTCHSLGHQKSFKFPRISFLFSGGVSVDIPVPSITYNSTIACFAFSGKPFNGGGFNFIWGQYQQRTLEVEYDLGKGRLGFGYGACK